LEDLPSDIWVWLADFLNGFEIMRLSRTGAPALTSRLYRSRVGLNFQWTPGTTTIGWPRTMVHFSQLKKLSYNSGKVASSVTYFPTVADLKVIPRSIEEIYLRCDGAEVAFRNKSSFLVDLTEAEMAIGTGSKSMTKRFVLHTDPADWFNAAEYWPNLKVLFLHQFSSFTAENGYFGPHLSSLPPQLHTLKIPSTNPDHLNLAHLPRGLVKLDLRDTRIPSSGFQLLPPTLENMHCSIANGALASDLRLLPRSLRIFHFRCDRLYARAEDASSGGVVPDEIISTDNASEDLLSMMNFLPPLLVLGYTVTYGGLTFHQHQINTAHRLPSLMKLSISSYQSADDHLDLKPILDHPQKYPKLILLQHQQFHYVRFPGMVFFDFVTTRAATNPCKQLILEALDADRLKIHSLNV
jgi:hypothetical protein